MDPRDRLTETQRDALWKWRWLGWRGSTPAFKASLLIAVGAAIYLAVQFARL